MTKKPFIRSIKNRELKREIIYNKDLLKFDGEYLNGERNGKGIEYYQDQVIKFIGKYVNGKRNGKGKEFYDDGKLKFDGEYSNDKKWNGKGYNVSPESSTPEFFNLSNPVVISPLKK